MSLGVESVGSTLKDSEMQVVATSMESRSSSVRVPSVREVVKKSIIERARRCFVVAILNEGFTVWWRNGNRIVEGLYACRKELCCTEEVGRMQTNLSWFLG